MRKPYLDNIRWMTVVTVVVYHVIYMFNGIETAGIIGPITEFRYQDGFQYAVYPWFMLLLFVVSGMCARFSLEHQTAKAFLRAKTRKLLVPSTLGLLVFGWATGYFNMILIGGASDSMGAVPKPVLFLIQCVSGTGPLWYIQMLWLFCVALLLFRKLEGDRLYRLCEKATVPVLLGASVLIWGAAQIGNVPVVLVYRFGIYGAGFLLGYLVFSHDAVMDRLERRAMPLVIAALLLGGLFTALYWGQPYAEHAVLDTFLCNFYAWIATLAVLSGMKKWGNFENCFTVWMSRKAWGLYLFHYLPLAAAAWYLTSCTALPPAIVYVLVGAAAFAGALALYEVFSRIPVFRWCVCGLGKG